MLELVLNLRTKSFWVFLVVCALKALKKTLKVQVSNYKYLAEHEVLVYV